MMKKTLFLLLISLIHSKIVNLPVYHLKDYETINVSGSSGLICYQLNETFKVNKDFYLRIKNYSHKIETPFYYNLTNVSCNNLKNLPIDFDNLPSQFQYKIDSQRDSNEGENGYILSRTNEKQKFMLMLFYNHKGNNFSVTYKPIVLMSDEDKFDLMFFFGIIFIITLLLFLCCERYCCEDICRGCCDCCDCDCCCRKSQVKSTEIEESDKTDNQETNLQTLTEEKNTKNTENTENRENTENTSIEIKE